MMTLFKFLPCALICALIAKRNNMNVIFWFFLGAVFGIFAIITAIVVRPK